MKIDRPPIIAVRSAESHDNGSSSEVSADFPVLLRVMKLASDKSPKKPCRSSWNMDGDVIQLCSLPEDEISTDYTCGVSGLSNPSVFGSLIYTSCDSCNFDSSRRGQDSLDVSTRVSALGPLDEEAETYEWFEQLDRAAFATSSNDVPPQAAMRMSSSSEWTFEPQDRNERFEVRSPGGQDTPVTPPERSSSEQETLVKLAEAFKSGSSVGKHTYQIPL